MEQAERLMWWGAALCFIAVAILLYGELTGWWNDAGEVAITVATIVGALLAAIAILMNATRSQASVISAGVGNNGNKLDTIFEATVSNGRTLDAIGEATASNGRKLDAIGEATASNGRKLDAMGEATASNGRKLDTLHRDMASLKEGQDLQTTVLVEIRDRLG